MKWVPYGAHAWLLEIAEGLGDEAFFRMRNVVAELEKHPPPGLIEFVPAFNTVLLEFDPAQGQLIAAALEELKARLDGRALAKILTAPVKTIPVRYGGPDLQRVCQLHELSAKEVIELHSAPVYKVYMLGFAPGFPYLGDLDRRLHTPRLASPRSKVPVGAVAIGGQHTGVYTVPSPGGWNIIGQTRLRLFEPEARQEEMFFLKAGDRVRFEPVDLA